MTRHTRTPHQPQHAGEEPALVLQHDQLAAAKQRPVPRAQLSRRASAALWALRILVIILSAMVIYTFFSQLTS